MLLRLHRMLLPQIVTGERPQRGSLRMPKVPEECPQVRLCHDLRPTSCQLLPTCRLRQPADSCVSYCSDPLNQPTHWAQDVCDLILQCLEEEPSKRPTAPQLLKTLGQMLERPKGAAAASRPSTEAGRPASGQQLPGLPRPASPRS